MTIGVKAEKNKYYICEGCGMLLCENEFYDFCENKFVAPLEYKKYCCCKSCLTKSLNVYNPSMTIFKKLNIPFIPEEWYTIVNKGYVNKMSLVGKYVNKMELPSYKNFTYEDSAMLFERKIKRG